MRVSIDIPPERIRDVMTVACESPAIAYWCDDFKPHGSSLKKARAYTGQDPWYYRPDFWSDKFLLRIHDYEDDKVIRLHQGHLRKALNLMAAKHGQHFGDLLADESDSATADVLIQLMAFGEVRYG